MAKQQQQASPTSSNAASSQKESTSLKNQSLLGNQELNSRMNASSAFESGTEGASGPIPYKEEMEEAFGQDFSMVQAFFGQSEQMSSMGASAAAAGEQIVFSDANPGKEVVAHELTHVVQNRSGGEQGVSASSEVSTPGSSAEVEARAVGQKVAAGESAGQVKSSPGADIQRDDNLIEIEIVSPRTDRSVSSIAEDNVNTVHAILENFRTALENFESVVNNSSASEAAPRDSGLIALEKVGAFIQGKIVSGIAGMIPGGSVVSDIIGLGQGIVAAIQAEKARSARAQESNALMNFIVGLRTQVGTALATLLTNKVEARDQAQAHYDGLSESAQQNYILDLALKNERLTQSVSGDCSIGSVFTQISSEWINATQNPEGRGEAKIVINLNKDWEVYSAYIAAPRGDRLAEQILQVNGGRMNLNEWDVPRLVQWRCLYPPEALAWVTADFDKDGHGGNVSANMLGAPYTNRFMQNLRAQGIPDTVTLSGHQTS